MAIGSKGIILCHGNEAQKKRPTQYHRDHMDCWMRTNSSNGASFSARRNQSPCCRTHTKSNISIPTERSVRHDVGVTQKSLADSFSNVNSSHTRRIIHSMALVLLLLLFFKPRDVYHWPRRKRADEKEIQVRCSNSSMVRMTVVPPWWLLLPD
jgi:hypothetical protein